MKTYTVAGLYIDDEPVVSIVIEGEHNAVDATGPGEFQRWATSVQAIDPDYAERLAVAEMGGEDSEDDETEENTP